jgi:hypothetical protein
MNLDDLELELRKLPGVRAAGFSQRDDMLFVQVHAGGDDDPGGSGLAMQASRIAARHSDVPVTVELVRWREPVSDPRAGRAGVNGRGATSPEAPAPGAPSDSGREPRLVLLAVLTFPDADQVEVHLTRGDQRAIGRAVASGGAIATVEATIEAVKGFCSMVPYEPGWARTIESSAPSGFLVAVALFAPGTQAYRYGLAAGESEPEAAARATLHALNRVLALELQTG